MRVLVSCLVLGAALVAACAGPTPGPNAAQSPDPVIDGYAIGPSRDVVDPGVFHRLETTTRDAWRRLHPGEVLSGFDLRHAGTLADGTVQPGIDDAATFLMVVTVVGGGRHALVLRCPLAGANGAEWCVAG